MNGTDTMADRVHILGGGRPASPASERLGDEQIDGREQWLAAELFELSLVCRTGRH